MEVCNTSISNLERIMNREQEFLLETSSLIIVPQSFYHTFYKARLYKEMDYKHLDNAKKKIRMALKLLNLHNVKIIKSTVDELYNFSKILSEKAKYLNGLEKNLNLRVKYRRKLSESSYNKKIFNDFCFLANELVKEAKRKIYNPKSKERYSALVEIIEILTEKGSMKKSFKIPNWYEKKIYRRIYEDLHTDEKFVAALIDSAFGEPLVGISCDGDVRKIFKVCCDLITSKDLWPYNEPLIKILQKNPITLYCYSFNLRKWQTFTAGNYNKPFMIYSLSEQESQKVKEEIIKILKEVFLVRNFHEETYCITNQT
ncbi:MAG: hypothetical protein QXL88_02750 [Candidatus Pacearchaeota archaeon]